MADEKATIVTESQINDQRNRIDEQRRLRYQHDDNAGGSRFTLPTAGSGTDTISGALFTNEDVFDVNAALDATKLDQQRRH